ncbi:MAG: pyridoxal phosphate-dependent aminotransferase [Elusimicrobia bacterium]|nr:pyridoxal phosphate-dependent aminotransferase [Elusimicrobiota bacterium]
MIISKRVSQISPSPTLAITAKANQMKAQGIKVIGFGAGEPDFDTPNHIKDAAKKALDAGLTKYTPTSGIKELKDAISKKFNKDNGLTYSANEILVSCGAKHSLFNAILTLADDGDEVILPSPYWVSYIEMIRMAGAKAVIIKTSQEDQFKIKPEQLIAAITPHTKILILNSPSNPTGMIYDKEELLEISKILIKNNIFCISDEIYEKLIYDNVPHVSIASFNEQIKKRSIVVNGVSKAYAMTGWRIGYAAGPKEIIGAMSNLQDHSTSNPTSIAQAAAVDALGDLQEDLKTMVAEFKKRREVMVEKVNTIPGLSTLTPQGAFYCFINIKHLLEKSFDGKKIETSMNFADLLLEKAQVAVVPGSVFGDDHYIRLSYATSMNNITEGLHRIEEFVKKLS